MRTAGLLALLICLVAVSTRAQEVPTTFAAVEAMAAKLAGQPYSEAPSIEGDMRRLGYDQYRALRPRPDTALWRDGKGLFHVEFFPAGFIYDKPVQIYVVDGGNATPVALSADQFDFSDTGLKTPPQSLTPAGFRLRHPLNRPDKFDEVISFLGASYFRPIARGQIYGASARGLAIDTAVGKPEEFPRFRSFWLVKPEEGAADMTVWALLDSPGATGAFSFTIRPGARTLVDTKCVLFIRNDISLLGIAPLTSMFFAGKASMVLLSTGSLSFIRENMKTPYDVAFVPKNVRNAVPIGGASLVMFAGQSEDSKKAGWKFIKWLTTADTIGGWSRFTGYFAPRKSAYDKPEMKEFIAKNPDAKVALDQLPYAKPWFATYQTVAVRKALEDEIQALMNGKKKADQAVKDAQKKADELMRPYAETTSLKLP